MRHLLLALITFLFFSSSFVLAQNSPETDYQYQLSQYRRQYAEFQIYKKDYLENHTLDNEQKALQSAQLAIVSRELTLASFTRILKQSIIVAEVDHPLINDTYSSIDELVNYHLNQATTAAVIQTQKDLNAFNTTYQTKIKANQITLDTIQIVNKLAHLLRFSQKLEEQYSLLKPKIESKKNLALLATGLEEIDAQLIKINKKLETVIGQITVYQDVSSSNRQSALEKITGSLVSIQLSERKIVERLIDFDKNYVDR